jgi:hypothetical protein
MAMTIHGTAQYSRGAVSGRYEAHSIYRRMSTFSGPIDGHPFAQNNAPERKFFALWQQYSMKSIKSTKAPSAAQQRSWRLRAKISRSNLHVLDPEILPRDLRDGQGDAL